MNAVELLQYSFKSAFDILRDVTADVTQEQADWVPPGTANPIGATYWHVISGVDQILFGWGLGQPPLGATEGWDEKTVVYSPPLKEGERTAPLREVRIDLEAMHGYTHAVVEATQAWLATLSDEDLERIIETPLGEQNLAQLLATFGLWHINAHCGEIAALKGCQGGRGYSF